MASHDVARERLGAARWTLDHGRLRATKGWRTAAQLAEDLPRADTLVDGEVFYGAACSAMEEAARGRTKVRGLGALATRERMPAGQVVGHSLS